MKNQNLVTSLIILALAAILAGCVAKEPEKSEVNSTEPELPSLQTKLDERKDQFEKRASEEIKKTFNDGVQAVAMSGVMETALNVGDTAPDFTLPNATGQQVVLSSLLLKGPVILTWYRGGW